TITCPHCGHQATERMPQDACLFFYNCKGCGQRLKPKPGDCCVFCSYGSVPCPPVQAGQCGQQFDPPRVGSAESACAAWRMTRRSFTRTRAATAENFPPR